MACPPGGRSRQVNRRYLDAVVFLPKTGFYILATIGQLELSGQEPFLTCGVILREDVSGIVWKGWPCGANVATALEKASLNTLGTDWNPFPSLFVQLVRKVPEAWVRFLQYRRRYRSDPVPQWLVELRRDEQRLKRKLRKANALAAAATPLPVGR